MIEQHVSSLEMGFPREILEKPITERFLYFQNKLIAHPHLKNAYDKLIDTVYRPAGTSIIWVTGPTGVGKTTLLRKTVKQLVEDAKQDMESDPGFLPLVQVGLQDVAIERGTFDWKDFFKCLLKAQDEPLIERKINFDPVLGPLQKSLRSKSSLADLRAALRESYRYRRPKVVLIDEAQLFKMVGGGRSYLNQMENIKTLAETTGIVHVLFGTYDLLELTRLSGQLSKRSTHIHLPRYRCEITTDIEAFRNMLMMFQRHLPLPKEPNLVDRYQYFYDGCAGCIGVLKEWLLRALGDALENTSQTLTKKHLQNQEKSVHDLINMALEINKGEQFLRQSKKDWAELHQLLGWNKVKEAIEKQKSDESEHPPEGSNIEQKTPVQPETQSQKQVSLQSPQKRRNVGQRNEKRDPVSNGRNASVQEMTNDEVTK